MRTKPNWLDWIAYRLFWWRWNPLFRNNDKLRRHFVECWNFSETIEAVEPMQLHDWSTPEAPQ